MRHLFTVTLLVVLPVAPTVAQEAPDSLVVEVADLEGRPVGVAILVDGAAGILVRADLRGLPVGEHAVHLHETGVCEPPFDSAGGHLDTAGAAHGILSPGGMHTGDLPNFHVSAEGKARFDAFLPGVRLREGSPALLDRDGSALVVHALPDDYRSDPAGDAGTRIACGRIAG